MIDLKHVEFDYPEMPMAFNLHITKGQRVAIIGESGAGKSTLLNLIAGFEPASRGEIWLNGANNTHTAPAERPVSMLFQDNNLFLHLTVAQNIGLGLTSTLKLTAEEQEKVYQMSAKMGLDSLLKRPASQLSGGQKQRVALARTLLRNKPILLLDEPFSALDPKRRDELQQLVDELCKQHHLTLLMVTHQLAESHALFDRVITLHQGKIVHQ